MGGTRISPWDANDDQQLLSEGRIRPLFTLLPDEISDDEQVLEYLNKVYCTELQRALPYRETCLKNIALYRNKFYSRSPDGPRSTFADTSTVGLGIQSTKPGRLTVNYLFDLVNQRVARTMRVPGNVEIVPASNDYLDKVASKMVTLLKDHLLYINDMDTRRMRVSKAAYLCGEAYMWVHWNPELGPVLPAWSQEVQTAAREGRAPRLPVTDKEGKPVIGKDGEPLYVEKELRTGEVEFKVTTPLNTLVQLRGDWDKAEYFFYEEYVDVDELKVLYPNASIDLEEEGRDEPEPIAIWRNMAGIANGPQQGKVLVRYFRHKPTQFLAGGRWIVSTRTALLENKALQPGEQGLGLVRLTDYDVEGSQRGESFFAQGRSINGATNDLTSMQMRNQKMLAHPKWSVPKGSVVKKDALGNDIAIVEYSGPVEPKIHAPPPMNQESMQIKNDLKNDMQLILGASPTERGVIPPNIRSATGLQAMYEQEDMRSSQQNLKQATFVRDVIAQAINVCSAYYDKDDKRLISIVGRNNTITAREFDPKYLQRGLDVRIQNGNGLPTSKAVRFDMAMQLREAMPTYMTEERLAAFMEWGEQDKVLDAATKAMNAADAENESILSLGGQDEPQPYENHIVHWVSHVKEMQDRAYKVDVPDDVKAVFEGHVEATEMFMMEAARRNPRYAIELVKIPAWPMIFRLSLEDLVVLDAARGGNPLPLQAVLTLYETGAIAFVSAGAVPGAAPPAAGAGAGGFNAATNGTQGPGADNPLKSPMDAPDGARKTMEVPPDEQAPGLNAGQQPQAQA